MKTIKMDFKIPNYQVYLDTWNYYENKSKLTNINGKKLLEDLQIMIVMAEDYMVIGFKTVLIF